MAKTIREVDEDKVNMTEREEESPDAMETTKTAGEGNVRETVEAEERPVAVEVRVGRIQIDAMEAKVVDVWENGGETEWDEMRPRRGISVSAKDKLFDELSVLGSRR